MCPPQNRQVGCRSSGSPKEETPPNAHCRYGHEEQWIRKNLQEGRVQDHREHRQLIFSQRAEPKSNQSTYSQGKKSSACLPAGLHTIYWSIITVCLLFFFGMRNCIMVVQSPVHRISLFSSLVERTLLHPEILGTMT